MTRSRVTVLGATGHTGRMTVDALLRRGAEVLACGRNEDALREIAGRGVATRAVDVADEAAVRAAIAGADAVLNLAGPFLATGDVAIRQAIAQRVPYADSTGEQAFMHRARQRHHDAARDAGIAVVNALAYEYALGDLAVKAKLPEGGTALHVLYRSRRTTPSAGTKKSIARVMAAPCLGYEDWKLRPVGNARFRRTFATSDGARMGVSFAGGEVLTVPRHTSFRTVRTYIQTRPRIARWMRVAAPLARVALRPPVLRMVERAIDRRHVAPANEDATGEVHLLVEKGRHVVVRTPDPYLATAEVLAEGAIRLPRAAATGVVAPAEAFDAADVLAALRKTMPDFDVVDMHPST